MTTTINLYKLHKNQQVIADDKSRFKAVRCGRRFGKTTYIINQIIERMIDGYKVAYIGLTHQSTQWVWNEIKNIVADVTVFRDERNRNLILNTSGSVGFWSFENYDKMRGYKYDYIYCDEGAHSKKLQDFWEYVARPTLIDTAGGFEILSTPRGFNYFRELCNKDEFKEFHYTTYDNPLLPADEIIYLENSMPRIAVQQEIYANFVDNAGVLVTRDQIQYYEELPELENIYVGIDLAMSKQTHADYTAFVITAKGIDNKLYINEAIRGRFSFNQTLNIAVNLAKKYKNIIFNVEAVGGQEYVVHELCRVIPNKVNSIRPRQDKVTRFYPIAKKFEDGVIFFNKINTELLINELLEFPVGEHDDMVDALVYSIPEQREFKVMLI